MSFWYSDLYLTLVLCQYYIITIWFLYSSTLECKIWAVALFIILGFFHPLWWVKYFHQLSKHVVIPTQWFHYALKSALIDHWLVTGLLLKLAPCLLQVSRDVFPYVKASLHGQAYLLCFGWISKLNLTRENTFRYNFQKKKTTFCKQGHTWDSRL